MEMPDEATLTVDQAQEHPQGQAPDPGAGQERPVPQASQEVAAPGGAAAVTGAPTAGPSSEALPSLRRGQLVSYAKGREQRIMVAIVLDVAPETPERVRIVELGEPGVIASAHLTVV